MPRRAPRERPCDSQGIFVSSFGGAGSGGGGKGGQRFSNGGRGQAWDQWDEAPAPRRNFKGRKGGKGGKGGRAKGKGKGRSLRSWDEEEEVEEEWGHDLFEEQGGGGARGRQQSFAGRAGRKGASRRPIPTIGKTSRAGTLGRRTKSTPGEITDGRMRGWSEGGEDEPTLERDVDEAEAPRQQRGPRFNIRMGIRKTIQKRPLGRTLGRPLRNRLNDDFGPPQKGYRAGGSKGGFRRDGLGAGKGKGKGRSWSKGKGPERSNFGSRKGGKSFGKGSGLAIASRGFDDSWGRRGKGGSYGFRTGGGKGGKSYSRKGFDSRW